MTMTTIAFIAAGIICFCAGFMVGLYYTTKAFAEGRVKNVNVKYTG